MSYRIEGIISLLNRAVSEMLHLCDTETRLKTKNALSLYINDIEMAIGFLEDMD